MTTYTLENANLKVQVATAGAELQSVYDKRQSLELLWQGNPEFWGRRAPVLFPIVGRLANDTLVYKKQQYPMSQHGFARDCEFELIYSSDTQLEFKLVANSDTKVKYPFDFELIIAYRIHENQLHINYVVRNMGDEDLPFSIGGHPAFNWPLLPNVEKTAHCIEFECNELKHVRKLQNGLLIDSEFPSPVVEQKIHLNDDLFSQDALIFTRLKNRKIIYKAGDNYTIKMEFSDFPQFGLWTKPGAPFVCLEPWSGYASPVGFEDDIRKKPGIILLPENAETQLAYLFSFN
ncbi:MAG: aldose 1-epimerase family protein [Gammaproteobacteria bacterium]|nr:aldose 1-epimerase family protein [Gammaproteobacteria bacterium]